MTTPARIRWIDYARGIAIVLVVAGHVGRGLVGAALLPADGWVEVLDRFTYAFHVQVFFLLAGLLVGPLRPMRQVLAGKARTLVYPYVLWSLLQGAINIGLGPLTNNPLTPERLLYAIAFKPYGQFWFLYVLVLCHLLYQGVARTRLAGWPALVLAAAAAAVAPLPASSGVLGSVAANFVYFVLGASLSRRGVEALGRARIVVVLAPLVLALCVHVDLDLVSAARVGMAIVGIAGVLALAMVLATSGALPLVRALGERSLPIYVAHIAATSGTRILLAKGFGIVDPAVHLTLGLLVGLALPLGLAEAADILGIPWLFRAPQRVSERYHRARAPQGPVAREVGVG